MIRLGKSEDLFSLSEIYAESFMHIFEGYTTSDFNGEKVNFVQGLQTHAKIFVHEKEEITGFLQASQDLRAIEKLYVLPTAQDHGVGRVLMRAYLKEVSEILSPEEKIWLQVDSFNAKAIRFYERFGYRFTGLESVGRVKDHTVKIYARPVIVSR